MRARAIKETRNAHYCDGFGLLHQVVAGGRYRRPRGKHFFESLQLGTRLREVAVRLRPAGH